MKERVEDYVKEKKKEAILEDARNMASQNPEEIARLLKTWLSED